MPFPPGLHADPAVFDALLELLPDPVWFVDSGAVTRSNAAYARWRAAAADIADTLETIRLRALGGHSVMADVHVLMAGIERTFAVHANEVGDAGVLFMAREIPEPALLQADAAVERALLHLFTAEERLDEVLPKALEFLGVSDGWDAAIVWLQHTRDEIRPTAWWFRSEGLQLRQHVASLRFRRGHGVPGRALATREVVWIADILEETTMRRAELSAAAGLHSVVAVPLFDSDDTLGVLELFTRAIRPLSERKKMRLSRTGAALGRLIARRKAEEEQRRLHDLIERKSLEWMATFDSIALPIFLVTNDGRIARLNQAALRLTGSRFDDVVGRELLALGDREPWPTLADITTAVRDSGMGCDAQIADGEQRWSVSATLLAAQTANDQRVIIVLHDTTEVTNLQESVRRGEQLAALGELVAGVAHEVKNPIFGMGMTIELLERSLHDAESVEMLGAMRTWLNRLSALTENLLEYGKTWNIELVPGSIDAVVEQAIEVCRPRAAEANVAFERDGSSGGARILMDSHRLSHVFENLLTNAVQFSPAGERVTISIATTEESIRFSVRDRGPGFNPEDLPRLFQPFFTRRRGGTGLGLAIVQRIVDEHGGTITAINAEDGGAVISVRFPIYPV